MDAKLIFLPVIVQILLVFYLYILLARRKALATAMNQVDQQRRALHEDAWPDFVIQVNNAIRNQFEVPVLFYLVCVMFFLLNKVNLIVIILAWLFVISRIVHCFVHIGSNHVPKRRNLFMFGTLTTLAMTFMLSVSVFF